MLFETARTTAPWTLPSHGSLLTGRYPSRHGLRGLTHALPEDVSTWAERFRAAGFTTTAFVNSLYLTDRHGLHRGFDRLSYAIEVEDRVAPSEVHALARDWLADPPERLQLGAALEALRESRIEGPRVPPPSPEELERLRALGYH